MKKDKKSKRQEILDVFGVTEKELEEILTMERKDINTKYKKIFARLPKKMPQKLWCEIERLRKFEEGKKDALEGRQPTERTKSYMEGYKEGQVILSKDPEFIPPHRCSCDDCLCDKDDE